MKGRSVILDAKQHGRKISSYLQGVGVPGAQSPRMKAHSSGSEPAGKRPQPTLPRLRCGFPTCIQKPRGTDPKGLQTLWVQGLLCLSLLP